MKHSCAPSRSSNQPRRDNVSLTREEQVPGQEHLGDLASKHIVVDSHRSLTKMMCIDRLARGCSKSHVEPYHYYCLSLFTIRTVVSIRGRGN